MTRLVDFIDAVTVAVPIFIVNMLLSLALTPVASVNLTVYLLLVNMLVPFAYAYFILKHVEKLVESKIRMAEPKTTLK